MSASDFSSFPPALEQQFSVYEDIGRVNTQKALTFGVIAGVIWLAFTVVVYMSAPDKKHETKAPAQQAEVKTK